MKNCTPYLDIGTFGGHEILVNIRASLAHLTLVTVATAEASDFTEQLLTTAARVRRKIDVNVMIFSAQRFLHERFVEDRAVDANRVFAFEEIRIVANVILVSSQHGVAGNRHTNRL